MAQQTISARIELDEYSNRVLAMIKAKYGLNDKSEAIKKFIELYGDNFIEKNANEEYAKKIILISNNHFKKYGRRKMSLKELNELCEE